MNIIVEIENTDLYIIYSIEWRQQMRSIKPGRGPSGISFIGSIFAIIFGVFWTIMAFSMTVSAGVLGPMGLFFPMFGVLFILLGVVQAVYHFKNATGRDRFSTFDITEPHEEGDPSDRWIKKEEGSNNFETADEFGEAKKFCPYCGEPLSGDYAFCPSCGKATQN